MTSRRAVLRGLGVAGVAGIGAGCVGVGGGGGGGTDSAERAREAAAAFEHLQDLETALDDGYASRAVHGDGLGEVFMDENAPFVEDPEALDPERPSLLYYRLAEDGTYDAAGAGWAVAGVDDPPELFGREFHPPADHPVPGQDEHYGLNAWVFDEPEELFAPRHPGIDGPSFVEDLAAVREALGPFSVDATVAEDAGYVDTEEHASGYGVAFEDPDPEWQALDRPPILLFRMTESWYYKMLGAEWYVPTAAAEEPPTLLGQAFHDPASAHSPVTDQPEHYGLHAWLFEANPEGMFAREHPRIE